MKDDVNYNHVRIQAIDSRRIDEIGADSAIALVSPPLPLICKEPPKIVKEMRPGESRDLVPINRALRVSDSLQATYVFHTLRIEMDFPTVQRGKMLDLFNDAEFRAMLPVQERRNNC